MNLINATYGKSVYYIMVKKTMVWGRITKNYLKLKNVEVCTLEKVVVVVDSASEITKDACKP
jgi:hypothetical protein